MDLDAAVANYGVIHVVEGAEAKIDFIGGEIPVFRRVHVLENLLAVYGTADLAGLETELERIAPGGKSPGSGRPDASDNSWEPLR